MDAVQLTLLQMGYGNLLLSLSYSKEFLAIA